MSVKDRHKTFVWEYFDRGISKSSEGVTDEEKCKNCAAVVKCTGGSTSGMLRHLNIYLLLLFFGVHPLWMTTTSSSTLKTQHEEEESMC